MKMESKMNLFSMIVLFLALAGFDHFYQNLIVHQNQMGQDNQKSSEVALVKESEQEGLKIQWPSNNLIEASASINKLIENQVLKNDKSITKQ